MKSFTRRLALAAAGLMIGGSLAACQNSGSPSAAHSSVAASARAKASAIAQNKQVQADKAQLENEFIASLKASFSPAHPVQSVHTAVQKTFPKGNTAKIESFAVAHFTPAVLTTHGPGSARDNYANAMVTYAISQGVAATPGGK